MHTDELIHMANQIGSFFEAMSDRPEALQSTVQHMRSYWEPRMRKALLAHVDTQGTEHFSPFVAEALSAHRAVLA